MANLKRNKKQTVLPDEVNEYYESQRRERTSVAVMLGLAALVVTLLIGAALFFGGRWVYNQITDNDDDSTVQVIDDTDANDVLSIDEADNTDDSSTGTSSTSTDSSSSDSANTTNGSRSQNLNLGDDAQSANTSTPQSVPATGDSPEVLPHTGDPGM